MTKTVNVHEAKTHLSRQLEEAVGTLIVIAQLTADSCRTACLDHPRPSALVLSDDGSGKTTVGRLLAARLGWPLVDSDEVIEERTGRTVREILQTDGEPAFRALETAALRRRAATARAVGDRGRRRRRAARGQPGRPAGRRRVRRLARAPTRRAGRAGEPRATTVRCSTTTRAATMLRMRRRARAAVPRGRRRRHRHDRRGREDVATEILGRRVAEPATSPRVAARRARLRRPDRSRRGP